MGHARRSLRIAPEASRFSGVAMDRSERTQRAAVAFVARIDRFTPHTSPTSANYAGTTPAYNFYVLGASYDLTSRFTLTADWQAQSPTGFPVATGTNVRPVPKTSTLFLHWQATF